MERKAHLKLWFLGDHTVWSVQYTLDRLHQLGVRPRLRLVMALWKMCNSVTAAIGDLDLCQSFRGYPHWSQDFPSFVANQRKKIQKLIKCSLNFLISAKCIYTLKHIGSKDETHCWLVRKSKFKLDPSVGVWQNVFSIFQLICQKCLLSSCKKNLQTIMNFK